MRYLLFVAAVAVAGCAPGPPVLGPPGDRAALVSFGTRNAAWGGGYYGIRRNFVFEADRGPVSFNVVLAYPGDQPYRLLRAPGELSVWVGYAGADSLGLGDGSAVDLVVDGIPLTLASDPERDRNLEVMLHSDRTVRGTVRDLAFHEFGSAAEFGLYPLDARAARLLRTAERVEFVVRGTDGEVRGDLSEDNLANVQRFLRAPVVFRLGPPL